MKYDKERFRPTYALIFIMICCLLSIAISIFAFSGCETVDHSKYIRLHIRADSDDPEAQEVKLKVRDAIVGYLTVKANKITSKEQMEALINDRLDELCAIADDVLKQNGFDYSSTARLSYEDFPQKSYGDLTLEAGEYQALIIELGSGKGDNWWCVAYPPLCFIAAEDNGDNGVQYRSIIAEFFKDLKQN